MVESLSQNNEMKILVVTNMYPTADRPYFGIFVKEQIDAIKKYYPNVDFDVYCIEGGGVKGKSKWLSLINYMKSVWEIDKLLRKRHYDLVHVQYGFSGFYLLNPFHKRTPVLVTLHGGDIQPEQKKQFQVFATREILRIASFAITLNERMDGIARQYIKSTKIIPCSIDSSLFQPSLNKNKYSDRPLIVFPSKRERFEKNYPLFEETITLLKSQYGIDCETIEMKNMSREEVKELYQKADLLLMTSISEGSPQVVKEAMACNLPVVSTPVGDVRILLNGVKGSAVSKQYDAHELARLANDSLSGRLDGINGSDQIKILGLDSKTVSDKIYDIYQMLAKK